jgi:prevent-host-death family protein
MLGTFKNIQPLTEFRNNAAKFLEKLRTEKSPLVLTVNGRAECVVLDADSFEENHKRLAELESENERLKLEALKAAVAIGAEQAERGELVNQSIREIFAEAREGRLSRAR